MAVITTPVRAIDSCEPGGDLVHGPMEIVDPALQRDRELDQVLAPAAHERPLRVAEPPHPHPRDRSENRGGDREGAGALGGMR